MDEPLYRAFKYPAVCFWFRRTGEHQSNASELSNIVYDKIDERIEKNNTNYDFFL